MAAAVTLSSLPLAQGDVLRRWSAPPGTRLHQDSGGHRTNLDAVRDLDGDGIHDILLTDSAFESPSGTGVVFLLSGREPPPGESPAVLRAHFEVVGWSTWGAGDVGDLDGDGVPDYAISRNQAGYPLIQSRCLSGRTGEVLFDGFQGALGDLNGDGIDEFVVNGTVTRGGTFEPLYPTPLTDVFPLHSDVDQDGTLDIAALDRPLHCHGGARIGVYSGKDGLVIWSRFQSTCSPPFAHGDMDGDGLVDLTTWTGDILDGETGVQIGSIPELPSEVSTSGSFASYVPSDWDGNGVGDLTFFQRETDSREVTHSLLAMDGETLQPLWKLEGLPQEPVLSIRGLDWNADGFPDFLRGVATDSGDWEVVLHSGAPAHRTGESSRAGVRSVGVACSERGTGPPRIGVTGTPWIGERLEFHLTGVNPGEISFLLLGKLRTHGAAGSRCFPSVEPGRVHTETVMEVAPGLFRASAYLDVPNSLSLVGTRLYAQWVVSSTTRPTARTVPLELEFGLSPQHPTVVLGRVVYPSGIPSAYARVELIGQGKVARADANGDFLLEGVVDLWGPETLIASAQIAGTRWSGVSQPFTPIPGRATKVEVIVLDARPRILVIDPTPEFTSIEEGLLGIGTPPSDLIVARSLPQVLAPFAAIWHQALEPPSRDQVALAEYVRSGGGLVVRRFHPDLLERTLLTTPPRGTSSASQGTHTFTPGGPDGINVHPNELTTLQLYGALAQAGVPDRNVFLRSEEGLAVGAAWFRSDLAEGRGYLAVLTDHIVDPSVLQNLRSFLLQDAPMTVEGLVHSGGRRLAGARISVRPGDQETISDDQGRLRLTVSSRLPAVAVSASMRRGRWDFYGSTSMLPVPGASKEIVLELEHSSPERILVTCDAPSLRARLVTLLEPRLAPGSRVDSSALLPESLAPYDSIWFAGGFRLSPSERQRLLAFVEEGGVLQLSCEGSDRARMLSFLRSLLPGRSFGIDLTSGPGPFRFESGATHSITTVPHRLTEWHPAGAERLSGLRSHEVLVRDGTGLPVGAAWAGRDLPGEGRLTLLLDSGWVTRDTATVVPVLENLLTFGARPTGSLPAR